jgi:hypothetical protein
MEIKPITKNRQPNYPTIELFVKHPKLLSRNIPRSWLKNKVVATSLAGFFLSSCGPTDTTKNRAETGIVDTLKKDNQNEETTKSAIVVQEPASSQQKKTTDTNNIVTNIAPVFAHGEGRGAIGCEVISPPVFISEDEAMKIIMDKLTAEGYNFSREKCPTFSFEVYPIANECDEPKGKMKLKLKMDAYNSNSKWAIQFISTDDHDKFKNDNCWSSVSGYDAKKAAEIINQELKKQKRTNAVVFYDPMPSADEMDKHAEAQNNARELLLAQVNDFIDWLKKNNIIIK